MVKIKKINVREFLIKDLNCKIIIEFLSRKDMLFYIDEFIENVGAGFIDDDEVFEILYKDGTEEYINTDFVWDKKKLRKINIVAIVWNNPCTNVVYGNFEINNEGIVYPSFVEKIAEENIKEVFEG